MVRRGRGGPELGSRAKPVVPVGVWDVSQWERPHPNKRLKLPAPTGTNWRCHATRPACEKEALHLLAAAVRAAA